MSMYEIESLLADTIRFWPVGVADRARVLGNLERLPERLELDAGCDATGESPDREMHVYELGVAVMERAHAAGVHALACDWCAFLLNFWSHMPDEEAYTSARISADWFPRMRAALRAEDVRAHQPRHATLTLYRTGARWFEDEHNALVREFFDGLDLDG